MVMTRSMTARQEPRRRSHTTCSSPRLPRTLSSVMKTNMAARQKPLALPHDMVVEIAAHIAATSLQPMKDICSLRATCQGMRAACKEGAVASRVALEREEHMRWFNNDSYNTLVRNLADAGNPEACFVLGLTRVFAQRCMGLGIKWLRRAAASGHKVAAYVLGVLHYGDDEAERYIRQVEGEDNGVAHGCKQLASGRTNRECVRCREQAIQAVREVTWKVAGMMGPVPVPVQLLPVAADQGGQGCKGSGCGVPEGWAGGCAVFCSDGCRIRHEYTEFFSLVPLPLA